MSTTEAILTMAKSKVRPKKRVVCGCDARGACDCRWKMKDRPDGRSPLQSQSQLTDHVAPGLSSLGHSRVTEEFELDLYSLSSVTTTVSNVC